MVIAAGGSGRRFGGSTPKQFLLLGGKPILHRTIAAFHRLGGVGEIIVVAPAPSLDRVKAIVRRGRFARVSCVTRGGKERQDSVWIGLNSFRRIPGIVLVHDGVRPLVTGRVI